MYGDRRFREGSGLRPTMFGLNCGDKLQVTKVVKGKIKGYTCTVIKEQNNFITVDRANYRSTVDKLSVLTGELKIARI